jgi:hypothetical protein
MVISDDAGSTVPRSYAGITRMEIDWVGGAGGGSSAVGGWDIATTTNPVYSGGFSDNDGVVKESKEMKKDIDALKIILQRVFDKLGITEDIDSILDKTKRELATAERLAEESK